MILQLQVFVQTVKSVGSAIEKFADALPSLPGGAETPPPPGRGHIRHSSRDLTSGASHNDVIAVWETGVDPHALNVTVEMQVSIKKVLMIHSILFAPPV